MCNTGLKVNSYKQACRNKGSIGTQSDKTEDGGGLGLQKRGRQGKPVQIYILINIIYIKKNIHPRTQAYVLVFEGGVHGSGGGK